jgi:hypothetical protein
MRKIAALLLLLVAVTSFAGSTSIAGSYSGPDPSYGLIVEVAPDGSLRGNYVESGRVAVLNGIEVSGTDFRARASFDDGSLRALRGSVTARGIQIGDTFFTRF